MTLGELNNITRVRFNNYTNYDTDKCHNGGCYGFWTDCIRLENGEWRISYGTTADIPFCPCCGTFNDHYDYHENVYTCGGFVTGTTVELLYKINNLTETEDDECIEYQYN